jgi:gamma-glutamyl hydrolase
MGAYVKYIESSGARVVPIIWGEPEEDILEKLKHIDGVLFPGGDGDDYDLGKFVFD